MIQDSSFLFVSVWEDSDMEERIGWGLLHYIALLHFLRMRAMVIWMPPIGSDVWSIWSPDSSNVWTGLGSELAGGRILLGLGSEVGLWGFKTMNYSCLSLSCLQFQMWALNLLIQPPCQQLLSRKTHIPLEPRAHINSLSCFCHGALESNRKVTGTKTFEGGGAYRGVDTPSSYPQTPAEASWVAILINLLKLKFSSLSETKLTLTSRNSQRTKESNTLAHSERWINEQERSDVNEFTVLHHALHTHYYLI